MEDVEEKRDELVDDDETMHEKDVHWLTPAPATKTHAPFLHSVWFGVCDDTEDEDGVEQGEPVHWLTPAPAITTQELFRHSVWFGAEEEVEDFDEVLDELEKELLELELLLRLELLLLLGLLLGFDELKGGTTHGELVHWLRPAPAMMTQALLRHSV